MSLRVIGYEGQGMRRRAIRVDEGPASARIATSVGEGKAGLIAGIPERPVGGYGEVERRYVDSIDDATRQEARAARVRATPIHAHRPAGTGLGFTKSRQRGAQRAGFVAGATKPYLASRSAAVAPSPMEEPVVSEPTADYSEVIPAEPDEAARLLVLLDRLQRRALRNCSARPGTRWPPSPGRCLRITCPCSTSSSRTGP